VARTFSRAITTITTADRSGDDDQHDESDGSSAARQRLGGHGNNAAFDDADGANKKRLYTSSKESNDVGKELSLNKT
jgi:hypothetical protein